MEILMTYIGSVTPGFGSNIVITVFKISWIAVRLQENSIQIVKFFMNFNNLKEKNGTASRREQRVSTKLLWRVTAISVSSTWQLIALSLRHSNSCFHLTLTVCSMRAQDIPLTKWHPNGLCEMSVQAHSTYHRVCTAIMCFTWARQGISSGVVGD